MSRISSQRKAQPGEGGAPIDPRAQPYYPGHPQQYHLNLSPSTMYPQSGYYDPNIYHQPQLPPYVDPGWQAAAENGSSRSPLPPISRELYAGYPPTHGPRSSSSDHPTPPTPRQWALPPNPPQSATYHGAPVKLDDLISHDRDTSGNGGESRGPGGLSSMPLSSAAQGQQAVAGPSKVGAKSGAAEASGPSAPSDFIKKLYKMLEEETAMFGKGLAAGQPRGSNAERGSVGWARGGISFVVWDMNDFTTKILPQTFRHSNFSSFVRQLNKYGFSKIKHTDEETGVIKENVWEFQHPNFQAGGRSDLDSIKASVAHDVADKQRKAAVSKKVDVETDMTPIDRQSFSTSAEHAARLAEMESRVQGLEEQLAVALEDVQQAKLREQGTAGLLREMLSHMTASERGTSSTGTSPANAEPSPRIMHMWQIYEHLTAGYPQPAFGFTTQQRPSYPLVDPRLERTSLTGSGTQPSPATDNSRKSHDGSVLERSSDDVDMGDTMHTIPERSTYPPDGSNPVYAETPAWLTKGVTVPMPMYHRKNSDGVAYRLMMDALGTQGPRPSEAQDPLDPTPFQPRQPQSGDLQTQPRLSATAVPIPSRAPIIQSSPFGTLIIPSESSVHPAKAQKAKQKGAKTKEKAVAVQKEASPVSRRGSIQPHWNKTPSILVVEDDLVYRQLSKKFLEKFGCVVETVENAHEAIEMINKNKYDLVLMDIFFGPSMDGRKATSLIRQFDRYTPIISMTSNAQPQDISSYLQSGMNDILAKPFTKHGLFGILDKHLLHMKVLQLSAEVPRSVGVPPLSDQGVQEAVAQGAAVASGLLGWSGDEMRNPLAAMGWSDDTYQIVLDQFLRTGTMPDVSNFNFLTGQHIAPSHQITNGFAGHGVNGHANGGGTIGPSVVFGDFNSRKRSLEMGDGMWGTASVAPVGGMGEVEQVVEQRPGSSAGGKKEAKRVKREGGR